MRTVITISLVAAAISLVACKRGLPEECTQYLAQYDCFLGKMNTPGKEITVETMRTTWTESSKTGAGRSAVLQACQQSQAQMAAKFAESGCNAAQ
jgi:hypothetical protein